MAGVYFISPKSWKNLVLLLGSLLFYAWGEPRYVFLMMISMGSGYGLGLLVGKCRGKSSGKILCAISVGISLSFLLYFKYGDFFLKNINAVTGWKLPLLHVGLPVGIRIFCSK